METGVVAAAAATAVAAALLTCTEQKPKMNILTVTRLDFEKMIGMIEYDTWFTTNLRCNQSTFLQLVAWLRSVTKLYSRQQSCHSFEKKVAIYLYFIGSQGGYREVAGVFGVAKSWCISIAHQFPNIIAHHARTWIYLPTDDDEWDMIMNDFQRKKGIRGIVGAIDGTLIDIQRPVDFEGFYNRKGRPSLNIQAVVDSSTRFLSIDIRPGSFSDKKVWNVSTLGRNVRNNLPLGSFFVCDAGYALYPWLIIPYLPHEEGGRLNASQRAFNYKHSSTRMSVECAFGRLKERFRILKGVIDEKCLHQTVKLITSCFVMDNIFLFLNDDLFEEGCPIRDRNEYVQPPDNSETEPNDLLRRIARSKRDAIAVLVNSVAV